MRGDEVLWQCGGKKIVDLPPRSVLGVILRPAMLYALINLLPQASGWRRAWKAPAFQAGGRAGARSLCVVAPAPASPVVS